MKSEMKRKLWNLLLAVVLLLCLAACGKSPEEKWQEQYDLGMKYISEGNYEEAVLAFTAAIEIDPKKADTYANLAYVYASQDDMDSLLEILQRGREETENLYDALLAAGDSKSPEGEPELPDSPIFSDYEWSPLDNNEMIRDDYDPGSYVMYPEIVMELLEPLITAGQNGDYETLTGLLEDEQLWSAMYLIFGSEEYSQYYPDANAEGAHFLQTWTIWNGDLFSMNKNTYTKTDDNGERRAYKTRIQYRPKTGTGFYLCLYEDSIDESYLWVTGEMQDYLYNGPFTSVAGNRDGFFDWIAQGTAVDELVDGEYMRTTYRDDGSVYEYDHYQYDMGKMLAPWQGHDGLMHPIRSVRADTGYESYGGGEIYAEREDAREALMYPCNSPTIN